MASNPSGTDISTLGEEGSRQNHFVSLIVNNAGDYHAFITRRVERTVKYRTFGDESVMSENKDSNEEVEYFELNVEFTYDEPEFLEIEERIKTVKETKAEEAKKAAANKVTPHPYHYDFENPYTSYNHNPWVGGLDEYFQDRSKKAKETQQKINFGDWDDWDYGTPMNHNAIKNNADKEVKKNKNDESPNVFNYDFGMIDDDLLNHLTKQLLTGAVTLPKDTKMTVEDCAKTCGKLFYKRFGNDKKGMKIFSEWARGFIDFLCWDSMGIEDDTIRYEVADEISCEIADRLIEYNPDDNPNIYIEELCKILQNDGSLE